MKYVHYSTFEHQVTIIERINFAFIDPPSNLMIPPYDYKIPLSGSKFLIRDLKNKRLSKFIDNNTEYVLFDRNVYDLFPDACRLFDCRTTIENNDSLLKFRGSRNALR